MTAVRPDSLPATVAPEEYPWLGPAARSAVLTAGGIVDLEPNTMTATDRPLVDRGAIERALAAEGAAPLAERTLVLAVGSNQTPATIARKYARSGADIPVTTPSVRCTVENLAVGHVASSAAPGYVPAAPYRAVGERLELVATWFDAEQLAVVDRTEPNYDRVRLRAEDFPVVLATGERPAYVDVYASHRGVLAREGVPIPLRHRQQELFDELLVLTGDQRLRGDAAAICALLAEETELLRELACTHGLIADDGIPRPATS